MDVDKLIANVKWPTDTAGVHLIDQSTKGTRDMLEMVGVDTSDYRQLRAMVAALTLADVLPSGSAQAGLRYALALLAKQAAP